MKGWNESSFLQLLCHCDLIAAVANRLILNRAAWLLYLKGKNTGLYVDRSPLRCVCIWMISGLVSEGDRAQKAWGVVCLQIKSRSLAATHNKHCLALVVSARSARLVITIGFSPYKSHLLKLHLFIFYSHTSVPRIIVLLCSQHLDRNIITSCQGWVLM